MKKIVRVLLRSFYSLLAVSVVLGIAVFLPFSQRERILEEGIKWWYVSLIITGSLLIPVGIYQLHDWAFRKEG